METFGGFSPEVVSTLREAAEWRKNKLASSEYDETTWAARTWTSFVSQRISVAAQLAMAQEAVEALGFVGGGRPPGAVSSGSRPMNAGPRFDLPLPPHATAQYMLASVCR